MSSSRDDAMGVLLKAVFFLAVVGGVLYAIFLILVGVGRTVATGLDGVAVLTSLPVWVVWSVAGTSAGLAIACAVQGGRARRPALRLAAAAVMAALASTVIGVEPAPPSAAAPPRKASEAVDATVPAGGRRMTLVGTRVNVRSWPSVDAPVLASPPGGTPVLVLEERAGWVRVDPGSLMIQGPAWVNGSFVRDAGPRASPAAPQPMAGPTPPVPAASPARPIEAAPLTGRRDPPNGRSAERPPASPSPPAAPTPSSLPQATPDAPSRAPAAPRSASATSTARPEPAPASAVTSRSTPDPSSSGPPQPDAGPVERAPAPSFEPAPALPALREARPDVAEWLALVCGPDGPRQTIRGRLEEAGESQSARRRDRGFTMRISTCDLETGTFAGTIDYAATFPLPGTTVVQGSARNRRMSWGETQHNGAKAALYFDVAHVELLYAGGGEWVGTWTASRYSGRVSISVPSSR